MNQEKIGKFILDCRKNKKLTQSELAEKLGVTNKSISNWENGRNMPDLSLFKPLCELLDIRVNDLISGEKMSIEEYQNKLDENIINTIDYTNKKILQKNNLIGIILISFGIILAITALCIFPSESSWGNIYSVFGGIISSIGISRFTKKINYSKRLLFNFGYFILFVAILFIIDYLSVVNIKQAPRFSTHKISGEKIIYYDTLFYDVVRCNVNCKNETYKVIKNKKYNVDNIDVFCK